LPILSWIGAFRETVLIVVSGRDRGVQIQPASRLHGAASTAFETPKAVAAQSLMQGNLWY